MKVADRRCLGCDGAFPITCAVAFGAYREGYWHVRCLRSARKRASKKKFTFWVGLASIRFSHEGARRTVTVYANDLREADLKAREKLDRRAKKKDVEPPTGWTLELKETET